MSKIIKNEVSKNLQKLKSINVAKEWAYICSGELLRLSRQQVPFGISKGKYKSGRLSQSGKVQQFKNTWGVVYDTDYAMYQHEGMRKDGSRVIRHWNNGRKGKYLEQPLLENMRMWESIADRVLGDELRKKL